MHGRCSNDVAGARVANSKTKSRLGNVAKHPLAFHNTKILKAGGRPRIGPTSFGRTRKLPLLLRSLLELRTGS